MRVSVQRARYVLEDMVKFGLMKRNKISGCCVDYYFSYDESSGKLVILDYFDLARKSLGIKLRSGLINKRKV